jgi:hypothetical protein
MVDVEGKWFSCLLRLIAERLHQCIINTVEDPKQIPLEIRSGKKSKLESFGFLSVWHD